jgi:competence protein ComEA
MMRMITTALLMLALGAGMAAAQTAGAAKAAPAGETVNLNTATLAQLEALPGIGPATAQRIVEYRQQSGGFKKIEELMNVRGIGEASFLKLKPLVTVTPPRTDRAAVQGQ